MKKCFLVLFLIFLPVFLFAEEGYFISETKTKTITAYKTNITGNLPQLAISLRLLDSSEEEFSEADYEIDMPTTSRGEYYEAFSWVLAGNAFSGLNLKFYFGQLCKDGLLTNTRENYIPYDVKLVYGVSRIGNSTLQINAESTATSYVTNNYSGTTYRFFYADSISGAKNSVEDATTISCSSSTAIVDSTVVYNMSTNTKVANSTGSFGRNDQYKTSYINAVSGTGNNRRPAVCDHWNRTGSVFVQLRVENIANDEYGRVRWTDNPSVYLNAGKYTADVRVEVSPE